MNEWKTKFFDSSASYDEFIDGLIESFEDDDLPIVVTIEDMEDVRIKDIEHMLRAIHRDTSFEVESTLYICSNCDKLHMTLLVDKPDDTEPRILN